MTTGDIVIASDQAQFFDPHVSIGLASGREVVRLARVLPRTVVLRMALMGRQERMSAHRAYELGMLSEGERLAMALHVKDPDALDFDDVIRHLLSAGLAKWKLPEQIVVWSSPLPRTASGKLQRRLVADDARARRRLLAPRLRPRHRRSLRRLTVGRPARRAR